MDQRTPQHSAERYGGTALGVECAWPQLTGAPAAAQGLVSPSSSSPNRDPDVGSASFFGARVSLSLKAETGDEVVVRLDDGRIVTVLLDGAQRFRPGERVRLLGGRNLIPT